MVGRGRGRAGPERQRHAEREGDRAGAERQRRAEREGGGDRGAADATEDANGKHGKPDRRPERRTGESRRFHERKRIHEMSLIFNARSTSQVSASKAMVAEAPYTVNGR